MNHKAVVVLALILGFVLGYSFEKTRADREVAKAHQLLINAGLEQAPLEAVTQLTGKIKSIQGNTLILSVDFPKDTTLNSDLNERVVTITDTTTIMQYTLRDPEEVKNENVRYEKEFAEYLKAMTKYNSDTQKGADANSRILPVAPKQPTPPFKQVKMDISGLAIGQSVGVTTVENVKTEKKFNATGIQIIIGAVIHAPAAVVPASAR